MPQTPDQAGEQFDAAAIAANLAGVRNAIDRAAAAARRATDTVHLVAVSKTKPAAMVRAAYAAGARDFGENYLQDALPKIAQLADLNATWHFIGRVQSNKTTAIANHFDWVHTVDRLKIATRLGAARNAAGLEPLNVCLQVNVDADRAKAGVAADQLPELAVAVRALPGVRLRGLMTILARDGNPAVSFQSMAEWFARLGPDMGADWDTLSMGMTADLDAAVAAGATHVRIGTAIFGARST